MQFLEPTGDKATRATGKVRHRLADLRPDHLRHEIRHRARRVEFTSRTSALQLLEDRFINLAKGMAFLIVAKVDIIDHVDDLTQQHTVLHVVVGVGKGCLHNRLFDRRGGVYRQLLERREERIVHEIQQLIARHGLSGLIVMRPIRPAAILRNDGHIVLIIPFPVLFLRIVYLEEEHPRNLLNALSIAIDACVVAHDVAQSLYKSG